MKTLQFFLQSNLSPNVEDAASVKSMLLYFVSLLLLILGLVLRHVILQNKQIIKDKDNVILDKQNLIDKLDLQIKEERGYIKSISNSVTDAINDNNNVIKQIIVLSDKNNTNIGEYIKPILRNNNDILKDISLKLNSGENG